MDARAAKRGAAALLAALAAVATTAAVCAAGPPLKVVPAEQVEQAVRSIAVRLPATWQEAASRATGAREFATVARAGPAQAAAARMTLTVEVRPDAANAVARLREIDAEIDTLRGHQRAILRHAFQRDELFYPVSDDGFKI